MAVVAWASIRPWPKTLPVVKLENFLDAGRINLEHPLNRRQQTLLRRLQTKHGVGLRSIDTVSMLALPCVMSSAVRT